MKKPILVYGIGNPILSDDGIGPRVVEYLQENFYSTEIKYYTGMVGGLEILEQIEDHDTVVFVDAIKTKHGIPGDVYFFSLEDFKETLHLSNLHDVSFLTAIDMGRKMGMNIPSKIYIIAVEIVEDMVFSNNFTPIIEKKYDNIKEQIHNWLDEKFASSLLRFCSGSNQGKSQKHAR